ncbi:MAG TPA: aminotransferase class V-fold PLP-dependent enzyme [Ignavibacteriales bacterium]|nr:aminotransferase class V-fold PLP-dependent enzyme [Ignavibacteriales bacterium]
MEITEARKYYKHIKTGKIYFNCAAIGPLSDPILKQLDIYLEERSDAMIENYPSMLKITAAAKEGLGRLLNCEPGNIAFSDNVSNSMNILARGIDWKPGDRIILFDIEFPSNIYPFMNLKSLGVEIDFVNSNNGAIDLEDIKKAITPRTRLLSISYVQFLSGWRCRLDEIGALCKSNNIIYAVDAIQGLGAFSIDVKKAGIDFLACGTQKWMLALEGLSFIYVHPGLREKMIHNYAGWTSVENAWNLLDYQLKFRKSAESFQNGTVSTIGVAALYASLKFFESIGYDVIEKHVLDNSEYFIEALTGIGINPQAKNWKRENLSGIVSFKHDKAQMIFEKLTEENIHPTTREGYIRFAHHLYNNKEEIDKAVEALKRILA